MCQHNGYMSDLGSTCQCSSHMSVLRCTCQPGVCVCGGGWYEKHAFELASIEAKCIRDFLVLVTNSK